MAAASNTVKAVSILFVEDDELILELQASILAANFPDIVFYTAVNGRLGLELFKAHLPDIVITDINMPELCGVQMCNSIHALKPETRFIAITGKSGRVVLQDHDGNEFEFDHVIVKPVGFQKLFAAVEQCMDKIAHLA